MGIAPQYAERIFQVFQRLHSDLTRVALHRHEDLRCGLAGLFKEIPHVNGVNTDEYLDKRGNIAAL
jgi:hypothetical protein